MKKIAFIFPGQGAQYVGMGKDFYDTHPAARAVFEQADQILGYSLSEIIFQGLEGKLVETKYSQLAIFVVSCAILATLDLTPAICAGLSLGEYTALYASGRLSFAETLLLISERARLMNEACERTKGTMAAVLGLSAEGVESAVRGIPEVWVANYNCPGQTVISGTLEGVERGSTALKAAGAKRVLPLTVHGAFHSGLMQTARDGLAPSIAKAHFQTSDIQLVMNAPGRFVSEISEIQRYLTAQVTESVRWEQGIGAMEEQGVDLYVEIGPGKTLTGMNKKIGVKGQTISIETVADLEKVLCNS